jgi:hypothetical protein
MFLGGNAALTEVFLIKSLVIPVVFYEVTNVLCVCTGLTQLYLLVEYKVVST